MKYQHFLKEQSNEPLLCYCEREKITPNSTRFGPVIRDVYIIECCTGGRGSVIINGTEFYVGAGDCYILLPGDTIVHTSDKNDVRRGVWCAVSGLQVGRCLSRAGIDSKNPFAPRAAFDKINAAIEKMLAIKEKQDMGADLYRTACIYQILSVLLDGCIQNDKDTLVKKAVGMIEAQYYNRLTVADMAAFVGLERSYFSTLFKQQMGLSPHDYLMRFRIQKACTMLKQEGVSVAAVAEAVGLDTQNFARIFKKEMSVTPLRFKNTF